MHSHLVGLDVWFLVGPIVYFHTSCDRTAKALARMRRWAGSPEPSLVTYVISTIISWAGSNHAMKTKKHVQIITPSVFFMKTVRKYHIFNYFCRKKRTTNRTQNCKLETFLSKILRVVPELTRLGVLEPVTNSNLSHVTRKPFFGVSDQ